MNTPSDDPGFAEQAEYWVVRLASGEIGADELERFKAWLAQDPGHRAAFDRERALWQSLEGRRAAFASSPPPRRSRVRGGRSRVMTVRLAIGAVAAAVAVMIAAPGALIRLQADQIAGTGEIRSVALPDGSTAVLDSAAAIAVRFGEDERRIDLLRGRAWFDVSHGDERPFRVAALGGVTQDIGTAFEVSNRAETVTVGVSEGAVRVAATSGDAGLTVHALERVDYAKGGRVRRLASSTAASIAPWRRGLILIDGLPVRDAIDEIARYRPGYTIMLSELPSQKISGVFRVDSPDEALQTLAGMAGLRVTTLPGGIAVLRR